MSEQNILDQVYRIVQSSNLIDVEYYELSARSLNAMPPPEPRVEDDGKYDLNFGLKVAQDTEHETFIIRLRADVHTSSGACVVDLGAVYQLDESESLSDALLVEFANNVGAMALLPYVRERVQTLTAHLKHPIILPTVQRGELRFDLENSYSDQ